MRSERLTERAHTRHTASTRVDWRVRGDAIRVVSYVANLSGGGIMIETSMPAPVGTTIDLRLLTDRGAVHASGKVAWSGREGMGLAFQA